MATSEWKIGERIENRYEIHKILRGGMGVVYICYDHEFREPVALKTFQDRYLESQQMRERFIREAETWVALEKHQNIVRAEWVENIRGKPYIILEYIANPEMGGAGLRRWIRRGIEVPQVLNFAVQFCDGMGYVHKKVGIVHRDIKPENILVTQDRVVKITDFGLVKTVLAEAAGENFVETAREEAVSDRVSFTRTGAIMGTPPYMSPEQCRNAAEVGIRSDIYAFGTVLYEMLTGRWVFEATTSAAFVRCHLSESPPSPCSVVPGLSRNLEAVVLRCLAKDPGQRYLDFAMLREELAEIYQTLTGEEIAPAVEGEALEAWEWNNKGSSLVALGYFEEAISCYDHALKLDSGNTKIWDNKGVVLADLGCNEKALACYDRALNINPKDADAWVNKGFSLHALGRYKEALACCDRALSVDSRDVDAWTNKGASLNSLGRYEEAFACHDYALNLNPKDAKTWLNKGNSLHALGRYEEALASYELALDIEPKYDDAWLNKGASLNKLGRYKEAIRCSDRALDINPKNAEAWFNKGIALLDSGQPEEALVCYDCALDIDPGNANAWTQKGIFLAMTRKFQKALTCFAKVLEIEPYNENAKKLIARCKQDLKQG